jgi:hypothetical protein
MVAKSRMAPRPSTTEFRGRPSLEPPARRDCPAGVVWGAGRRYRYALWRTLRTAERPRTIAFIMLNPSTADGRLDDPTLRRCCGLARAWDFDHIAVYNLFAYRATDPRELRRAIAAGIDPVGRANDRHLYMGTAVANLTVCAWGNSGGLGGRASAVIAHLRAAGRPLHHLGMTGRGEPRHPLYLPGDVRPRPLLP